MTIQSTSRSATGQIRRLIPAGPKATIYFLLALVAGSFVLLNLRTAMYFPPWIDEVMQVDAAVNLHLGNGWISTAWPQQSQNEFWAANNPLYTLFVYCWISIWGFSPVVVRSLNYILVLVIAWLIVDASRRSGLIQSLWARIVLAALLICNQAVTFVYRSGRADLVTMLIVALLFWTYTSVQDPAKRRKLLFLCAIPMLASGLHAIPYAALLLILDYVSFRKCRTSDIMAIVLGCLAGSVSLAMFFLWKHSLMAYINQTFASAYNIVGSALIAMVVRDNTAVSRFLGQLRALSPISVLQIIAHDASALPLICFLLYLFAVLTLKRKRSPASSIAMAGLIAAVLIPYGMLAAGRYPFYYAWMGATPVAIAFSVCLEKCWVGRQRFLLGAGLLAGIASIALGMPSEIWRQAVTAKSTQYFTADQILIREARAGVALYGDPVLYYAAKSQGIPFLTVTYATGRAYPRMTDAERSRISILIVRPEQITETFNKVGGDWTRQNIYQLDYGFSLVVCRRVTKTS